MTFNERLDGFGGPVAPRRDLPVSDDRSGLAVKKRSPGDDVDSSISRMW